MAAVSDDEWAAFIATVKIVEDRPPDPPRPERNRCARCHQTGNLVAVHLDGVESLMHKMCRHRVFRRSRANRYASA